MKFLIAALVMLTALGGCGSPHHNKGIAPPSTEIGAGVDKPSTQIAKLGYLYSTALVAPSRSVTAMYPIINLEYIATEATHALQVKNSRLVSSCNDVSYYFTWSELGPDNQVLNETAAYTINVAQGRRYLLRLYSTRLRARCTATVTYSVAAPEADSRDAAQAWPKLSYLSVMNLAASLLSLQVPDGIKSESGSVILKLERTNYVLGGESTKETLLDIDGSSEKLTVANGVISSACTKDGAAQTVAVGSVTDALLSIDKEVLTASPNCTSLARTLTLTKIAHGLIELHATSPQLADLHAYLAPAM